MLIKKEINGYSTVDYHHQAIHWIEKALLGRELTLIEKVRLGEYVEPVLEKALEQKNWASLSKYYGLVQEIGSRFLHDYYGFVPDGNFELSIYSLVEENPDFISEYFQSIQRKAHMPEL